MTVDRMRDTDDLDVEVIDQDRGAALDAMAAAASRTAVEHQRSRVAGVRR